MRPPLYGCEISSTHKFKKMSITEPSGNWEEQKVRLKQKMATIAAHDSLLVKVKKEEIMEKLQEKLGKTKEELFKIIGEF